MGADFIYETLPAANIDNCRLEHLRALAKADMAATLWCDEDDERLEELLNAIEAYPDLVNGRDTALFHQPDYDLLITGGMSRGDGPTEAFYPMTVLASCEPIWKALEEYARVDHDRALGVERQPLGAK